MDPEEKLRVLKALLINTVSANPETAFAGMHVEDQQCYLMHCGQLAAEAHELVVKEAEKRARLKVA